MKDKPKFLFPMQNLARYKVIPCVMLLMALLLTASCNKDDDEKNKKFRLSGSKYLEDDSVQTNNSFHYLDDRVSLVRSCYYLEQEDSVKTEIDYTDEDNLEQVSYFKAVNQWWPFDKLIFKMEDGKIVCIEEYNFDASYWEPVAKKEYIYKASGLSEEILFYHEFSSWTQEEKITYDYEGSNPIRAFYYYYDLCWRLAYKEEAIYTGGKIDSITGYGYAGSSFIRDAGYKYRYENKKLAKIDAWSLSGSPYLWQTISFTYNPEGNLESESSNERGFAEGWEYVYEEGTGNYPELLIPGSGLIFNKFYPGPVKSAPAPAKRSSFIKNHSPGLGS